MVEVRVYNRYHAQEREWTQVISLNLRENRARLKRKHDKRRAKALALFLSHWGCMLLLLPLLGLFVVDVSFRQLIDLFSFSRRTGSLRPYITFKCAFSAFPALELHQCDSKSAILLLRYAGTLCRVKRGLGCRFKREKEHTLLRIRVDRFETSNCGFSLGFECLDASTLCTTPSQLS